MDNTELGVWTVEEIEKRKQLAKSLRSSGYSVIDITALVGVSRTSIYNWIKKGLI